jgi:hypothetical protein
MGSFCLVLTLAIASPASLEKSNVAADDLTRVGETKISVQGTLEMVIAKLGEPIDMSSAEKSLSKNVVVSLRKGDTATADRVWRALVESRHRRLGSQDVDALVAHVLRLAYLETSADLRVRANKIAFYNEVKRQAREHLQEVRKRLGARTKKSDTVSVRTLAIASKTTAKKPVVRGKAQVMTEARALEYMRELEDELASVGDDAQLANVDLQNALQKQQQTLQMMSNMSKSLHDTAKSIIRKLGG